MKRIKIRGIAFYQVGNRLFFGFDEARDFEEQQDRLALLLNERED